MRTTARSDKRLTPFVSLVFPSRKQPQRLTHIPMWCHRLLTGAACARPLSRRAVPSTLASVHLPHLFSRFSSFQYRNARAIALTYHDGTCSLAVPLPLNGFDEERVFRLPLGRYSSFLSFFVFYGRNGYRNKAHVPRNNLLLLWLLFSMQLVLFCLLGRGGGR